MQASDRPAPARSRARRPFAALFVCGAVAALAAAGAQAGDQDPVKMDETRAALEKWVQTRQIISKEREDWKVERSLLEQRIGMIEGEIADYRASSAEARASIDEAAATQRELDEKNEALKEASQALEEHVAGLEQRVLALATRFPPPLRKQVDTLLRLVPENPAETELGLGQRYQSIVGVLTMANKFNREVHAVPEVRTLPDGTSATVTVLYVGLGQAWYVTEDGMSAGVGTVGEDGWVWNAANEHAAAIQSAVAIWEGSEGAEFQLVPLRTQ